MTKLELQQRLDALSAENGKLRAENSALRVQLDAFKYEALKSPSLGDDPFWRRVTETPNH